MSIQSLAPLGFAVLLAACSVAPTGPAVNTAAAPATPASSAAPAEQAATASASAATPANPLANETLVGTTLVRGDALPSLVAYGWRVGLPITPTQAGGMDFWRVDKEGQGRLIVAKPIKSLGGGRYRYQVHSELDIPLPPQNVAHARCASPLYGAYNEYALIDLDGRKRITWLAHMDKHGTLIELKSGAPRRHKCSFDDHGKRVSRVLAW
ncbi:hypothetical protein ABWL39_01035 [Chitinivorax sp. PXF-14]|uniref:hypothetical protein n=1 Tax=Chitinivorax sp. PXF-14 TaxID=3230488 RepID=UPI0034671862